MWHLSKHPFGTVVLAAIMLFSLLGVVVVSRNSNRDEERDAGNGDPTLAGVSLQGAPASLAVDAMIDLPGAPVDAGDVVDGMIMTRADVFLDANATTGQVNSALESIEAAIVTMSAGTPAFTIAVPRQGSVEEFRDLMDVLEEQPGIFHAAMGRTGATDVLPPDPAGSDQSRLEHLLAARFPAAWNVKEVALDGCASNKVPVVIADWFGSDVPVEYDNFKAEIGGAFDIILARAGDNPHGLDVTTILLAADDQSSPTGATPFPQCLDVTLVNFAGLTYLQHMERIELAASNFPDERFVLNGSFGFGDFCVNSPCAPAEFGNNIESPYTRVLYTLEWIARSRMRWHEVLVVTSAGNDRWKGSSAVIPGLSVAQYNGWLELASHALFYVPSDRALGFIQDADLWDAQIFGYPSMIATDDDLQQIREYALFRVPDIETLFGGYQMLAVGSSTPTTPLEDGIHLEESGFSDSGPDLWAVGEGPDFGFNGGMGTSYSAPQVAGLAAYLWLLSPDLRGRRISDTRTAIVENTFESGDVDRQLDAYATVLSLDPATAPSPTGAPIRLALLDVADDTGASGRDGLFNEKDLAAFSVEIDKDPASVKWDHSRYDLNGDGFTGGASGARFDLDRTGSTQFGHTEYSTVTQAIETESISFDETEVTDLQVLCYYAYSPLYTGDRALRDGLLGIKKCAPPFNMTFFPRSLVCGTYLIAHASTDHFGYQEEPYYHEYDAIPDYQFDQATGERTCDPSFADPYTFEPGTTRTFSTIASIDNQTASFIFEVVFENTGREIAFNVEASASANPSGIHDAYIERVYFGGQGMSGNSFWLQADVNNRSGQHEYLVMDWSFAGTHSASGSGRGGWLVRVQDGRYDDLFEVADNSEGSRGNPDGTHVFTIDPGQQTIILGFYMGARAEISSDWDVGGSAEATLAGMLSFKLSDTRP